MKAELRPHRTHLQRITPSAYRNGGASLRPGEVKPLCGVDPKTPLYSPDPHKVTCGACRSNRQFVNYQAGWDALAAYKEPTP